MSRFSQFGRFLQIQTKLGDDALLLTRLRGREGVSELYQFDLDLLAEQPIAFDPLLSQAVSIRLQAPGSAPRVIAGIVSELSQGDDVPGPEGLGTLIRYHARVVPHLWLLTQRVQSRVWQRQSVLDILRQILHDEWQLDVHIACSGEYRPRNYCVQYRESDLAFISRLMEEEGIGYTFEHRETGESLIMSDLWTNRPMVASPGTLSYAVNGAADQPRIHSWTKTQKVRAITHVLRDHCFQLPSEKIESGIASAAAVKVGTVAHAPAVSTAQPLEVHEYPCGVTPRYDGIRKDGGGQSGELPHLFDDVKHGSQLRRQAATLQGLSIQGASNVGHLEPGRHFSLVRHRDGDGEYLLTRVEHEASLEGAYLTRPEDVTLAYGNHFAGIPAALPYRPARVTPKPRILGTQTATVVGRAGDEIFCDKYGRIKVRFHWDGATTSPGDDSCWIRVAQPWAGKGFGSVQVPRVGQEVVVDFQDGDPDRPLVLGGVYNAEQMPPYQLPDESSHSGFKSRYLGSDYDSSEIRFDDTQGSERLHLASDNDLYVVCARNQQHSVGDTYELSTGTRYSIKVGSTSAAESSGAGGGITMDSVFEVETPNKVEVVEYESTTVVGGASALISGPFIQVNSLFSLDFVIGYQIDVVIGKELRLRYSNYDFILTEHNKAVPSVDVLCSGAMTYTVTGLVTIAAANITETATAAMALTGIGSLNLTAGVAAAIATTAMLPASITHTVSGVNKISVSETAVKLAVGDTCSITLETTGINLVFGTSQIQMSAAGIKLFTSDTQYVDLTAALLTLCAGASKQELASAQITIQTANLSVT